jgi:hypothetical protein
LDLPAEVFRAGLDRRRANRAALLEWVRAALVEGVDFGRIHTVGKSRCQYAAQGRAHECADPRHWSKPSLFKPGAEKICGMLGVTVHYPTLQDYEAAALHGVKVAHIILRCEIRDAAGRVVADGVGARSLEQDGGDLNKALKMAEKSAHIDATLRMAGLSEVFTQDLEDMPLGDNLEPKPNVSGPVPSGVNGASISSAQHRRLEARIRKLGLDRERVNAWVRKVWGCEHLNELPAARYSELDQRLAGGRSGWPRRRRTPNGKRYRRSHSDEPAGPGARARPNEQGVCT